MNHLVKFLDKLPEINKHPLPYYHNCSFEEAMDYAQSGKITSGEKCDVFHEDLVYLFLGKGRYIKHSPDGSTKYTPISFVIKPKPSFKIDKIFPFDTGACSIGLYEHILMRDDMVRVKKEYNIGTDIELAYRLIMYFFKSLEDYVNDKTAVYQNEEVFEQAVITGATQLEEINEIYRTKYNLADGRKLAVEVQVASEFDLKDNTEMLMVPSKIFEKNQYFSEFCNNNNVDFRIYAEGRGVSYDLLFSGLIEDTKSVSLEYLARSN